MTRTPPPLADPSALAFTDSELAYLQALPRHRHDLTREQVRRSQSGRILFATAQVVAERGYAGATVLEIARRAGVSRKTFYELFEDKEGALLATYETLDPLVERMAASSLAEASRGIRRRDILAVAIEALLGMLADFPDFTRMFFLEALGAGPRVRRRRSRAIEQFADLILPALELLRSREAPDLEPVDRRLSLAVVGAGMEAIVRHLAEHDAEALRDLAPELTATVTRILLPSITGKRRVSAKQRRARGAA